MQLTVPPSAVEQAPVHPSPGKELNVVIASLALGGAEFIVLDWAARIAPKWQAHLIVLRDQKQEWPVPDHIRITRLHGVDIQRKLKVEAKKIAKSPNPVCLCHLLRKVHRDILSRHGVFVVPVLHNARSGWLEDATLLQPAEEIISVSQACAEDLRASGWEKSCIVIRHLPAKKRFDQNARSFFREKWRIPENATVIGMIGAVKPQKNYLLALEILKGLLEKRDAYLAILGGPIGKDGLSEWRAIVLQIEKLKIRWRVAMPGFIADAANCLPAFDALLNTSHYEGLSMATLEALANGKPAVAREVGGQGEIRAEGLRLVAKDATIATWVAALEQALDSNPALPKWAGFPAYRLWNLAQLARPVKKSSHKILFVTANLNSGGAQRSLVNLAKSLNGRAHFEIAVAGNSTVAHFYQELRGAGITVFRSSDSRDAFDNAETLVQKICTENIGTVCFWNLDSKIKLLLVKSLGFSAVRFVDVSPGDNSFDEMAVTADFQELISFNSEQFYARLDQLVLKFRGSVPSICRAKTSIIPNGVPMPSVKTEYALDGNPKIVVNGRITPTKFLVEILSAMQLVWEKLPGTELHVYGAAEPRHAGYAQEVLAAAAQELNKRIFFHGLNFEVQRLLPRYDAYVVLGKDQGCPNALLEALAAGLPAIGNNNGGTAEQIIDRETGLLIEDCQPGQLAATIIEIIEDRRLAAQLGQTGRARVLRTFSMQQMRDSYLGLFKSLRQSRGNLLNTRLASIAFQHRLR